LQGLNAGLLLLKAFVGPAKVSGYDVGGFPFVVFRNTTGNVQLFFKIVAFRLEGVYLSLQIVHKVIGLVKVGLLVCFVAEQDLSVAEGDNERSAKDDEAGVLKSFRVVGLFGAEDATGDRKGVFPWLEAERRVKEFGLEKVSDQAGKGDVVLMGTGQGLALARGEKDGNLPGHKDMHGACGVQVLPVGVLRWHSQGFW
jgi:hypothetical protein